jgi:hypothetical protein
MLAHIFDRRVFFPIGNKTLVKKCKKGVLAQPTLYFCPKFIDDLIVWCFVLRNALISAAEKCMLRSMVLIQYLPPPPPAPPPAPDLLYLTGGSEQVVFSHGPPTIMSPP